ncbi:ATP-binding cassette transporter, subfamily I, member 2, SmABCI2 [Selaginella moellendorffii]|uniref:ATP-binding cassette transporter, subfamily I, member 2, SmABCI2 n=1 Tax=Selaginella moellendorffii TaxID=88036 RepID=D8QPW4_SELML|nr:ABC transporter I family member 21 [Selaginella moellendorffii]EFJ37690.1 ATP-binding cassette transporter, subfamily I, member 2, SmABCI2 [Selaginella moellendorffii]|eukprot:XP_002960151.1 ABC transporter I family member 21 [Selaginella moellendorffii]
MEHEGVAPSPAPALSVRALQFSYPGQAPFVADLSLALLPGTRCLLVGANGAGKTTLLRIFAGKHLVGGKDVVQVLGRSAFHDTALTCDGDLAYLGESWNRPIGSAGDVPLQGDFTAEHMIFGVEGIDPDRRQRLIDLLDINLQWKMHKVSDGQRRRVQICMGLLRPYKVLLLDEITVDLDVVGRMDLLSFFIEECTERGCTIVYATHIFDGLEAWATHLAYVVDGKLERFTMASDLLSTGDSVKSLLNIIEPWLRDERKVRESRPKSSLPVQASPWASSRHMAYYR